MRKRHLWLAWGVAIQVMGLAIPVIVAVQQAKHDGLPGLLSRATVRLIVDQMLHSRGDVALVVLGAVLFTIGSVVLARPFVCRRLTLVVAVPVAAFAGVAVLGVVALLIAVVLAGIEDGELFSSLDFPWGGEGHRRRRDDEGRPQ